MRKVLVTLMMVFGLSVAAFAEVILIPKESLDKNTSSGPFQHQIGYYADTWEEVYEKTGIDKYGWKDLGSDYNDDCTVQLFMIIKGTVDGEIGWICIECPGDGSVTTYVDKRLWYSRDW